ncbi:adenosylcobinamide-GDP ribazoletransferase [Fundidesulfovibrio agrisoli]|uniref:adenosylcobinamide-GDP ribazoletransferase n=1 Tax=Fundidesulfovibrio agrisoli TaxID=2922717 RepID=UPI001FACA6AB|nr:adenosylcobinamide-GDP ribazoletransferase [Fundidesulfovibrio agrisoli]
MNLHIFSATLSFLTRLGRPRILAEGEFARTLAWFPLVGLAVGLLAAAPGAFGLFSAYPLLLGWLAVGLSLWFTRGLHADGLADVADAWGSGAVGERFWTIMKDSRAGPFGVLGLVMGLGGQVLAFGELARQGRFGAIAWCFVLGRALSVMALAANRRRVRPGLSSLFAPGATAWVAGCVGAQAVAAGLLLDGWRPVIIAVPLCGVLLWRMSALSRKQCGFNGDFMGAAIMAGELLGALAALA